MSVRKPIVISPDGTLEEIPSGDVYYGLDHVSNTRQQFFHGFVDRVSSDLLFNDVTHVLTLQVDLACLVFLAGVPYTIPSPGLSIDLTDQITEPGLFFIWVEVGVGGLVLNSSNNSWSITNVSATPVATLWWNGANGALSEERHGAERNLQLHRYLHFTVGARIANDGSFTQLRPTTAIDGQIELSGGVLWHEAINNTISGDQNKRVRHWYETSAGVWTFTDGVDNAGYDRPYLWNAVTSRVQFPDSDNGYALTDSGANGLLVLWVFASNDVDRPIYVITSALPEPHSKITLARSTPPPIIEFAPEVKLLYQWIFKGDGQYQGGTDYRNSSSLPGGGIATPIAVAVNFTPTGDLQSGNVQAALEELDAEKLAITHLETEHSPTSGLHRIFALMGS